MQLSSAGLQVVECRVQYSQHQKNVFPEHYHTAITTVCSHCNAGRWQHTQQHMSLEKLWQLLYHWQSMVASPGTTLQALQALS
jgi:hypothetical protein